MRLSRSAALALAVLLLASCSPNTAESTGDEQASPETGSADTSEKDGESVPVPQMPEYDFSSLDLSAYVTLPVDYSSKNYKEGLELLGEADDEDAEAEIRSVYLLKLAKYPEESAGADAILQDLDRVLMDYTGKLDGVAFQGGTAVDTEHDISILHSGFIDGFDRGMLGMKEGETRDLDLKFPDDYQNTELAGKSVVFTVKIHKIFRPEIPELTDALISENESIFGTSDKTAAEFKETVKRSLTNANKAKDSKKITQAVWDHLSKESVISSMPEEQKKGYEDFYYNYYLAMAASYNTTIDELIMQWGFLSLDAFKQEAVTDPAAEIMRKKLIIHRAAKDLGISVTDDQAREQAQNDYKTLIEPNIMYYTMYHGISDFEGYFEYAGGLYGYRENLLMDRVLERIGGIDGQ